MQYTQRDLAAEAATADLLCCPPPPTHYYVGETIHRRGKWGHVTMIEPSTQRALVEWSYPSFGYYWLER